VNPGDHLAEQLDAVAESLEELTKVRASLIRGLREFGWSLRAIAEAAHLSHTAVAKILEGGNK